MHQSRSSLSAFNAKTIIKRIKLPHSNTIGVPTAIAKLISMTEVYIGWRTSRYGPLITRVHPSLSSGLMLKFPSRLCMMAQTPKRTPIPKISKPKNE